MKEDGEMKEDLGLPPWPEEMAVSRHGSFLKILKILKILEKLLHWTRTEPPDVQSQDELRAAIEAAEAAERTCYVSVVAAMGKEQVTSFKTTDA